VADVVRPGLELLLVGINPGLISARERAHFANPANPFWALLHDSGLIPLRLKPGEQRRLLDFGIGITNLVARESAGVSDLSPEDFAKGREELRRKIQRLKPRIVAFVGVSAFRQFALARGPLRCGEQAGELHGARVFVLPNPSGRNAHFSRAEMLAAFRELARIVRSRVSRSWKE